MSADTVSRINAAVNDCLRLCCSDDKPIFHLACCLQRLRADPTWSSSDIRYVEVGVLKLLRLIVNYPGSHAETGLNTASPQRDTVAV
jgi:hypothetical protein